MNSGKVKVFVQMAHGFGGDTWNNLYLKDNIVGINEPFAYGFHRGAHYGCEVLYSSDRKESKLTTLIRKVIFAICGFDLVHVWRNRRPMLASDVVWAFTESQSLAILFILALLDRNRRIRTVLQVTYLFDKWQSLNALHKWLFLRLLQRCSTLAVLSPLDREFAMKLLPGLRIELVRFGINVESKIQRKQREIGDVIQMVSAGNDRRRDWETLIAVARNNPDMHLTIISQKIDKSLLKGVANVTVCTVKQNVEYLALLDAADLMVVTTVPNTHTCGLTVIEEAALRNLPTVCSDTGGLRAYFSADEVAYAPPGDATALELVVRTLARDAQARTRLADNASAKMSVERLSSESYARAFAELSA